MCLCSYCFEFALIFPLFFICVLTYCMLLNASWKEKYFPIEKKIIFVVLILKLFVRSLIHWINFKSKNRLCWNWLNEIWLADIHDRFAQMLNTLIDKFHSCNVKMDFQLTDCMLRLHLFRCIHISYIVYNVAIRGIFQFFWCTICCNKSQSKGITANFCHIKGLSYHLRFCIFFEQPFLAILCKWLT